MGSCASRSSSTPPAELTAKVVHMDGSMAQFAAPVTANEALAAITGRGTTSHFICCSDNLYFDAPVRALGVHDALQAEQVYFALPLSMLRRPLSGQDMAALAVKASAALGAAPAVAIDAGVSSQDKNRNRAAAVAGKQRRRQAGRVAPLVVVSGDGSAHADGERNRWHVYGGKGARKAALYGGQTVGKTKSVAGYADGARRHSAVQRLSVIVEAASE